MTKNAEERLFEAVGQISDEFIQEADYGRMDMGEVPGMPAAAAKEPEKMPEQRTFPAYAAKLGRYLKYLPVAACLCIVFGSAYYIVNNYMRAGSSAGFSMSGGSEWAEDAAGQDIDRNEKSAAENGAMEESESQSMDDGAAQPLLPVRHGACADPVFSGTATGDIQKLTAKRSLKASITTEENSEGIQPLMQVTDTYQIENTSDRDKTLQFLYPFTGVLNQAQEPDGEILMVSGQENPVQVSYSIGDSIADYQDLESFTNALSGEAMKEYQEQALEKEADWGREVSVYTFSVQREDTAAALEPCVAAVAVKGEKADVLTFGADHSFEREDGTSYYCFFVPRQQESLYLIVTGEMDGEPEAGFYTNLDCDEEAGGMQYEIKSQKMAYTDALRLCSDTAAQKMEQEYDNGVYAAQLPEYMDADAAFRALTIISGEDDFYDMLQERYDSTELWEVFERMFGETRIVYAMATVTVPAGETVQVTARTQKQQAFGHYISAGNAGTEEGFRYDFFPGGTNRLGIEKTAFRLILPDEWQITKQDMGLVQKQDTVWKTVLQDDACGFSLAPQTDFQ